MVIISLDFHFRNWYNFTDQTPGVWFRQILPLCSRWTCGAGSVGWGVMNPLGLKLHRGLIGFGWKGSKLRPENGKV